MEGMNKPTLPPANITLRLFRSSDVDDFMAWESDDRVMRFLRRSLCTSREAAVEYFDTYVKNHPWCRAICVDDRAVGRLTIRPDTGEDGRKASIGYCLRYECWGRGIASVAVRMAVAAVFEDWPKLERLEAIVDEENAASARVLEKAGFQKEGLLRKFIMLKEKSINVFMYSFLSTDSP